MEEPTQNSSRSIPENVIAEILSRLPAMDVLRFKCVCTDWLSLISSPFFASLHLQRSVTDPSKHCFLFQGDYSAYKCPFSPIPTNSVHYSYCPGRQFVGSINGLVCIVGCSPDEKKGRLPDDVWIWNPCTSQAKKLPLSRHTAITNDSDCSVTFGFGWDPDANVYKVVKLSSGVEATWGEVWSSNLDSWREFKVDRKIFHTHCVANTTVSDLTLKGGLVVYWVVAEEEFESGPWNLLIASFDMRTEVLQLIPFPKLPRPHDNLEIILCDRLKWVFCMNWEETFAVADDNGDEEDDEQSSYAYAYDVWTLENTAGVTKPNWVKKFSFPVIPLFSDFLNSLNGKLVLKTIYYYEGQGYGETSERECIIIYDVETRTTHALNYMNSYSGVRGVHDHVMSLVSIKGFVPYKEEEEE